ncbi:MAG: polymer-forming cytoskeletal protein [Flavobacteriales bacterium]|nr:polymer-forming cytoskeletal protein [Flavobacteriales bacterium]
MFKNSETMGRNNENDGNSVNLIGSGTKIKGNIQSEGDVRIDGTLIGTIKSKGKVVVGSTGIVEGEIDCQNADISGTVKIKITVSDVLLLKLTAKLTGDIVTSKLAIESGATFSGTCSMGGVVKDIAGSSSESKLDDNDNAEMAQKAAEKSA